MKRLLSGCVDPTDWTVVDNSRIIDGVAELVRHSLAPLQQDFG